ncbi:Protein short hypocotyl in white light 1 [Vitis vinifera]|uniref:Protein short hypocotyl in white light 1 n=1 Tax=Vitis vinifera TaxID=29760 RepID=A0A438C094_VITVI|nr:Protein short hypocotyl in white light 1 [Vitis vinifera]
MMAGLGRLSGLIINLNPTATTKLNLNFTPSPNFTCPPQSFHLSHRTSPTGNPTTLTSHARLSGSAGEAPEEIDESFFEDEDLIESDEEDETESSADLLIKFLQSMFKKASKHAKKASRSVLPAAISPQLVCENSSSCHIYYLLSKPEFHHGFLRFEYPVKHDGIEKIPKISKGLQVLFLSVQDSLVANFIFGWEVSFAVDGVLILASLSIIKALLEVFCTLGGTVFVVILLLRMIWATVSYFQTSGNGFSQGGTSFGTTQPIT